MTITKNLIYDVPLNDKITGVIRLELIKLRWEQFAMIFADDYPEHTLNMLSLFSNTGKRHNILVKIDKTDFNFRRKLHTALIYSSIESISHREFNKCCIKLRHYLKDKSPETINSWFK